MAGPEAERYASHCFRRGAAAAIRRSGQTLSEIMRTGGLGPYAFREYHGIQKEEGRSTKAATEMDPPDSSHPGIQKLPRVGNIPKRNRILPLPVQWVCPS